MDRYWLLTWTTYGTWLPGDDRGFVSNVDDGHGTGRRVNQVGTMPASKQRGLREYARSQMKGPPVLLNVEHAASLLSQFQETSTVRGWRLLAVAIMPNHVHVVLGVVGDPEPDTLLRDLKSYGSRRLNQTADTSVSARWWTESGSRRKLPTELAVTSAVRYVQDQHRPLVVWVETGG